MSADPKPRELPEFVDDLVRIGVAELVRSIGTTDDVARAVMGRVAAGIVTEYARRSLYIPAGFDSRNEEIYAKYGQASTTAAAYSSPRVDELAAEYKLTSRQIYKIVGALRARELGRQNPRLPGFDDLP